MLAILLAAQLSAQLAGPVPADVVSPDVTIHRRFGPNRINFVSPRVVCPANGAMQTSSPAPALLLRPEDRAAVTAHKLGELPKANLEYAVERSIGGCVRPAVVRYAVERDGRFASEPSK